MSEQTTNTEPTVTSAAPVFNVTTVVGEAAQEPIKRKRGRPKGSKNKPKINAVAVTKKAEVAVPQVAAPFIPDGCELVEDAGD